MRYCQLVSNALAGIAMKLMELVLVAYRLTPAGRQQLAAEKKQWARIVSAIGLVLDSD